MLASWYCVPSNISTSAPTACVRHSQAGGAMMALSRCCRGLRQLCARAADSTAFPSASCSRMLPSASNGRRDVSMQVRQGLATRAVATKEDTGVDATVANKARALDAVLKEVNLRFGKGSIMKLGSTPTKVETIPSGALTLDWALGGGYPRGRIIEVYGPESSGKTTLALHAIAEVQRQGGVAALIDAEHAFDPEYSRRAGLRVEDIVLCQPDSGEMALEVVDQLVRSNAIDLIAVDSVAALVPRAEIEGEIGAVQVGAQARLMSQALRKIAGNASKCNCTVLFLNQLRHKIGVMYGNPEVTSGGNALKFYASVRLEVRRKQTIEGAKGENVGIRVKAKVSKNKCAPPYKLAEFDIMFGSGISSQGCLLDAAETTGVVTRKGSWYYYGEQRMAQGRDKTLLELAASAPMAEEIEAKTRNALAGRTEADPPALEAAGLPDLDAEEELDLLEEEELAEARP